VVSKDENGLRVLAHLASLFQFHGLVVIHSNFLVEKAHNGLAAISEAERVSSLHLVHYLVGDIVKNHYFSSVVRGHNLKQFCVGVPLEVPHWGAVLVRMRFLERLSSKYLNGLVGETQSDVFGVSREGHIVGKELAVQFGDLQHFFSLDLHES
jgi:hypothetical protein